MKLRKTVSTLLAVLMMSVTVFAGCNNQEIQPPQTSVSESSVEISESSKQESSKASENSKEESSKTSNISENKQITPAVWKITSSDGKKSIYMMGSIHVADNSVNNMPDYFENIYNECNALAVEVDVTDITEDMSAYISGMQKLLYIDGTTIKDHISQDIYDKAVKILKDNNMYVSLYDYYNPFMWTSLIESISYKNSGLNSNYGVDTVLLKRAKNDDKKILEVESADIQFNMMAELSEELQEFLLASCVEDGYLEKQDKALNELYNKWKTGTIKAEDVIDDIDKSQVSEKEYALLKEYNDSMLNNRNVGMADKAEEYMNTDDMVLFVVGSAHFYGEQGILQLMQNKGYTVSQVNSENVQEVLKAA